MPFYHLFLIRYFHKFKFLNFSIFIRDHKKEKIRKMATKFRVFNIPREETTSGDEDFASTQSSHGGIVGKTLDQLSAMLPIGEEISGNCIFNIFNKDTTPINDIFPEKQLFPGDYKHKYTIKRLDEKEIQVVYTEKSTNKPVFKHWPKYKINFDKGISHARYLANNTMPEECKKQVILDVRFEDKDQAEEFAELSEYGRWIGGFYEEDIHGA